MVSAVARAACGVSVMIEVIAYFTPVVVLNVLWSEGSLMDYLWDIWAHLLTDYYDTLYKLEMDAVREAYWSRKASPGDMLD